MRDLIREKLKNRLYSGHVQYTITENLNSGVLTDKEIKTVTYILGDTLTEVDGGDMYNKFIKILSSNKRNLITAAVMTVLLTNPTFSNELDNAPDEVKTYVNKITNNANDSEINKDLVNTNKDPGSEFSINFSNVFKSGSYSINEGVVNSKLNELKNYLTKNSSSKLDILIIASESQVPNQKEFGNGELAKKRAEVMNNIIEKFLNENNLNDIKIKIETRIGDVKWDGSNPNDPKYTKDQFIKVDLIASRVDLCDFNIEANGEVASKEDNYISFNETIGDGGIITMTSGSIPDRLVITNNDGKVINDTGYFSDEEHNYQGYKYVPLYVAKLTNIFNENPKSTAINGSNNRTKTFKTFNELVKFLLSDKNHDISNDRGNEIVGGLRLLKKLWDSGQREFVFYHIVKKTTTIEVPEYGSTITVYSPIGRTGYKLKGGCNI